MGKRKWTLTILLMILLASFCVVTPEWRVYAASSTDDWPMFHHDPAHTGYSTSSVPATTPVVLWTSQKGIDGCPVVADGYVSIMDQSNVHCINASNGHELWTQRLPFEPNPDVTPAISGGYIYTPYGAYNISTGDLTLNYSYLGDSSPTIAQGTVYVGSFGGGVFALDAATGTQLWNYSATGSVVAAPAAANGFVYFSAWDGNIYVLNASTGAKIWNYTLNSPLGLYTDSSPAVVGKFVYVGSNTNFYCLDALTGTEVWSYPISSGAYSPVVADGYVYVVPLDGTLYALNALTGAQIWNVTEGGNLAVASGICIVTTAGSGVGKVYALNASTGAKIWNYTISGDFRDKSVYEKISSPAIAGGIIYISDGFTLYAFGIPTPIVTPTSNLTPSPSPTIPEFPKQLFGTTLFVSLLLVASVTATVTKKRMARKTQ